MNYLEVYAARKAHIGVNHKQREYIAGIRRFEKYMNEHPSVEQVEIDGIATDVSIISNKQDANKLTKQILVPLKTKIAPGSLVKWGEEYWLIYTQERKPNQQYFSGLMVRCNYYVKWINKHGIENGSHAYVKGAMESNIKMNFRTWHGAVTPQANQFLEMLLPYPNTLEIGQRLIISGRGWFITDPDITSVKGIMYVPLTETKVDRIDDDVINGIADIHLRDSWQIHVEEKEITCEIGQEYVIYPQIYYKNLLSPATVKVAIGNPDIIAVQIQEDNKIIIFGVENGETEITLSLQSCDDVFITIPVSITEQAIQSTSIVGSNIIKVGQVANYYLISSDGIERTIDSIEISDNTLAKAEIQNNNIIITTNKNNKLGSFILEVVSNGESYLKDIKITPIW